MIIVIILNISVIYVNYIDNGEIVFHAYMKVIHYGIILMKKLMNLYVHIVMKQ